MITTILIGELCDLLQQEPFFTVHLNVQAWKQTTASNSALHCDVVSISIHSNVLFTKLIRQFPSCTSINIFYGTISYATCFGPYWTIIRPSCESSL
jgi:hypothetical protein